MAFYQCKPCGYIYNEEKNNLQFAKLPQHWVCPVCGAGKDQFEKAVDPTPGRMQPIGLLMIEHRLIEKIIPVLEREVEKLKKGSVVDVNFITNVADFFRTYADKIHHGKEENILFQQLKIKKITLEDKKLLEKLLTEHKEARVNVGALLTTVNEVKKGKERAGEIIQSLNNLIELYPAHIASEDNVFFPQSMNYFSKIKQDEILETMREFDRKNSSSKYHQMMNDWKGRS